MLFLSTNPTGTGMMVAARPKYEVAVGAWCTFSCNGRGTERPKGREAMRVVCISDTHGLHDALQTECAIPDGDVFIHAGDFTDTGDRDEVTYSSVSLSSGKRKPAARVRTDWMHAIVWL